MPLFYEPRNRSGEAAPRAGLDAFRVIPRFLRMIWSTKPSYAIGIVFSRLANALTPIAMLWVGKLIVDSVIANIGASEPDWTLLIQLVLLECAIALASDVLTRLTTLLEGLLGDLFANELAVRIMRHSAGLDLQHFESPEVFDKIQRARSQTMSRVALMTRLLTTGQQCVTLLSLLAAIVAFNWWLLLMLAIAILPSFFGETVYAGIMHSFMFRWTSERRELAYYQWLLSDPRPAKEIRLFGLGDYFAEKYGRLADELVAENRRVSTYRAATGAALKGFSTLAYYVAVGVIVYETVLGTITVGTLTFLIGSFQRSRSLISSILLSIARNYEDALHLRDLFDFLELQPEIGTSVCARPVPTPIRHGFEFDDVGYRYADSEEWAVRHISFRIRPGESLALVGENGAGKTTLVKLLTRLYDPIEGRILLDGVDIRQYDLVELRQAIGVIFQDYFRYDLPVRDNIAIGHIEERDNEDKVVQSARKSRAHRIIAALEGGYDQVLGHRFADGVELSGGEWQKIALARAYMREAKIVVLDEPTSALDARAEYEVFERFSELTANRMALLISHRFSTVRMARRILLLHAGRLVEQGSHQYLLDLKGRYWELFSMQASSYS